MRVPLTFFDTTPTGRIISRFAKDVDVLDTSLPQQISDSIYCLFEVIFPSSLADDDNDDGADDNDAAAMMMMISFYWKKQEENILSACSPKLFNDVAKLPVS